MLLRLARPDAAEALAPSRYGRQDTGPTAERLPMTIFASRGAWTARRLRAACSKHGVGLVERSGEVILDGQVVAAYELAGDTLILHDLGEGSPLIRIFDLQRID